MKKPSVQTCHLTPCPDCEKRVSTRATTCPNCGCPVAAIRAGRSGISWYSKHRKSIVHVAEHVSAIVVESIGWILTAWFFWLIPAMLIILGAEAIFVGKANDIEDMKKNAGPILMFCAIWIPLSYISTKYMIKGHRWRKQRWPIKNILNYRNVAEPGDA